MAVDGIRNSSNPLSGAQSAQQIHGQQKNVAVEASKAGKKVVEESVHPETKKVDEEKIIQAIEKANKSINMYNRRLEFSIHDATKEIMVKVIDTQTDEIIKEIPSEKILDMVARLWDLAGILVDEKA